MYNYILPCPFLLTDGSSNAALLRSIFEITAWLKHSLHGEACDLSATWDAVAATLMRSGANNLSAVSPMRLVLPSSLITGGKARWDSGWANLAAGVLLMSHTDESCILHKLIEELNGNLSMELDHQPNLNPVAVSAPKGDQFLVGGASNAERTAAVLERAVNIVFCAVISGWRCMKQKVSVMEDLVRDRLAAIRGDMHCRPPALRHKLLHGQD